MIHADSAVRSGTDVVRIKVLTIFPHSLGRNFSRDLRWGSQTLRSWIVRCHIRKGLSRANFIWRVRIHRAQVHSKGR